MWSSFSEKASRGLTDALEKGTQVFNQAEKHTSKRLVEALEKTRPTQASTEETSGSKEVDQSSKGDPIASGLKVPGVDQEKVLKNLHMGWTSITQRTAEATKDIKDLVDTERARLEENFALRKKGFHKRDPSLPLDRAALSDAEVTYVTDRIIIMSHPAMQSKDFPMITAERKLAAVGHMLARRHDGRFLVYNLSEVDYETSVLDDQVLTFSFPGSPAPPLGLLLKLLIALENWMKADDRNVAVVHCLTGKGRSSMVVASFLCWMGEAGFGNINEAIDYIAKCKGIEPMMLTIPSQRRYAGYFKNVLDGVKPSQPPLLLKRIIMSEAPRFAKAPTTTERLSNPKGPPKNSRDDDESQMGCAPYLQIFKAGKLIYTTAATVKPDQQLEDLPFVTVSDGAVPFNEINLTLSGDILIRARHLTSDNRRLSMFSCFFLAAFHSGYAPSSNVLRLSKEALDGACSDPRYPDDFFVDLIFEKVDAETATKHIEEQQDGDLVADCDAQDETDGENSPVVKATAFDVMLSGDSRVWEVISNRKKRQVKQMGNCPPTRGPTVGRRRKEIKEVESQDDACKGKAGEGAEQPQFSIGSGFELPSEDSIAIPSSPVKDSLMEALNALDNDENVEKTDETEEIVFYSGSYMVEDEISSEVQKAPSSNKEESTSGNENPVAATFGHDMLEDIDNDDLADMDALLASVEDGIEGVDLEDFDDNDDLGLNDFENMLNS
ncbi:unnamed protein product [Cylindrotheca closterium]|uniref:Phosphatidylinositol-3,4,5-trisphosphate 3-phosphatase n=1 Tax=Cylindrotheca closterium TaxID=2856 RepID=A0AAD2CDY6_9STRA|nr:unnamed protein product [Cylindrotheca closterium]